MQEGSRSKRMLRFAHEGNDKGLMRLFALLNFFIFLLSKILLRILQANR